MKTTIRDREVLNTVRPPDVLAYLRASGWTRESDLGERASLWVKGGESGDADVLVPNQRTVGDFALRIAELLATLERLEQRSQEQILYDIASSSADLVRIRALSVEAADGTIPLEVGVGLVEHARELLAAAAYAAVNPRAYWARRRPPQAVDYLTQVRLGQTERGSYVVTMVSPVTPALQGDGLTVAPFERRVTETLMQALRAASHAAQAAAESGNMAPFNDAVAAGVSANLCDALAGLGQASPKDGLEISVSWSRTRPGQGTLTSIPFSSDYLPILREASRRFKEAAPREEFDLFGLVVKLDRSPGTATGTVVIDARVDDRSRRVLLELGDPFYQEAIRAHRGSMLISCTGELVKEGKSLRLRNPAQFEVFSPESESL